MNPDQTPVDCKRIIVRNNKVPPKIGAPVMYVLAEKDSIASAGAVRPGIITEIHDDGSPDGQVTIVYFTSTGDQLPPVVHAKLIQHNEEPLNGTWHWPPPREIVFESVPFEGKLVNEVPPAPPEPFLPDTTTNERLKKVVEDKGFFISEPPSGFEPADPEGDEEEPESSR